MNGAEILTRFTADTSQVDKATKGMTTSFSKLTGAFTLGNLAAKGISKAIGIMNANLDGAIKRTDTMNNFPKVMSNLGIGAQEADEAIKILSDKLKGLPTALDTAASSVQRLTSKNGDVKKSTNLFLALNNAVLAGGASSDIQRQAIEQMSQAYAKGKPDMMEWRSMMTAMPAQLKQVATAMGYADAAMLGEAVRAKDGEKVFAKMMDTMMKMNTQGVSGFKSFEEQARNSTGGIQTSLTNMKTAFVRGLANMVNTTNDSLKSVGGLSGVLSKIGQAGEKAFSAIGKGIQKVIPIIINIINWIKEHETLVKTLTVVIVTFVATFKTIQKVIAIVKAVKSAVALLNATMLANPIGIVIAAIVALVAGFVILWKKCEGFRNFWINMWNGIKKVFSTVVNFVKKNWKIMLLAILNPFAAVFKLLYDHCDGFRKKVNNTIKAIKNFFANVGAWVYAKIITPIMNVVNGLLDFLKNVGLMLVAIITIPIDWLMNNVFLPIRSFIKDNVIDPVVEKFTNAFNLIKDTVTTAVVTTVEKVKSVFLAVKTFIWNNILSPGITFFTNAFNKIFNTIKNIIAKVKNAFNTMKNAVKTAFDAVAETIKNIFNTIGEAIKAPINGIINGINKVLEKINGLTIPDWVPKIGGKHPNFKMIPTLDTGTNYVPKDTLAMIHQGEAVVPKKFNPYANGLNASMLSAMGGQNNIIININNDMKFDALGQMVNKVKTFSGGAKNDFNYGMGR